MTTTATTKLAEILKEREAALMDERQAARFLGGISAKHVYNLRQRGDLPFLRVGARVMYSRSALEKWIAEREQRSGR